MPWILLVAALEVSYYPDYYVHQYTPPVESIHIDLGIVMDAEVHVVNRGGFCLFVGGRMQIPMVLDPLGGWPTTLNSIFRAGATLGLLTVGLEHWCGHPVCPWEHYGPLVWEGWYQRVFVRVSNQP